MNQTRLGVGIIVVAAMAAGWIFLFSGILGQGIELNQHRELAAQYKEDQLYELAIEEYKQVAQKSASVQLYSEYLEVYQLYYAQKANFTVMNELANLYNEACKAYPRETGFWEGYVQLYLDREEYAKAAKVLHKAQDEKQHSERLEEQYRQVFYAYKELYGSFLTISPTCPNGYYTANTGEALAVLDANGKKELDGGYAFVGYANPDREVAVVDAEGQAWLMDVDGMAKINYPDTLEQAGCYSEGLLPVRLAGEEQWGYWNGSGELLLGGYQAASFFEDGKAAVKTGEGWQIIDTQGNAVSDVVFQDLRLTPAGGYLHDGYILAKQQDKWAVYSDELKLKFQLDCEEMDGYFGGLIAFCRNGLWGFVDLDGNEVIAPAYQQARSFSGGVAAVCKDGLWGFIDEDQRTVIEYQYADVGYFSEEYGSCPVLMQADGAWNLIAWQVQR